MNTLRFLYKSIYTNLLKTGISQGKSEEETRDVINQTFLDFAEKKINFDKIDNPEGYILVSFKRKLIDDYRVRKRNTSLINDAFLNRQAETNILEKVEEKETQNELSGRLYNAYIQLPKRCQRIIYLKYFLKLSNEEITKITALSQRSIYNNLSVGIKLLRKNFKEHNSHLSNVIRGITLLLFCFLTS